MATQTIYRNTHTSAFTALDNVLLCSTLDATAQKILTYLLSKPTSWRLRATDLKNTLGLTYYKIKKGLKILKALGYVTLQRLTTGHTVWRVFETPIQAEPPVLIPSVDFRHVEIEPDLSNTELIENTDKQLPDRPQPLPSIQQGVVFFDARAGAEGRPPIPIPDSLKGSQERAARKLLANITHDQALMVLMVFNAAMQNKRVNNPVAYLHQLVKAAQSDTLTAPAQPQQQTLDERISKQREALKQAQNRKIDNASHFARLRAMFGSDGVGK